MRQLLRTRTTFWHARECERTNKEWCCCSEYGPCLHSTSLPRNLRQYSEAAGGASWSEIQAGTCCDPCSKAACAASPRGGAPASSPDAHTIASPRLAVAMRRLQGAEQ